MRIRQRLFWFLLGCFIFYVGLWLGNHLNPGFVSHPILMYRAMDKYPLGSRVIPVDTQEARELFENRGWTISSYAYVVGYHIDRSRDETYVNYIIRTYPNSTMVVNDSWIDPSRSERNVWKKPKETLVGPQ